MVPRTVHSCNPAALSSSHTHSVWAAHMAIDDHGKCCPNHRLPAMRNYSDWEIVAFWDRPLQRSALEPTQVFCAQVSLNHSSWLFLFILSLIMNLGIWNLFNLQKYLRIIFASARVVESCSPEIFFISLELGKISSEVPKNFLRSFIQSQDAWVPSL